MFLRSRPYFPFDSSRVFFTFEISFVCHALITRSFFCPNLVMWDIFWQGRVSSLWVYASNRYEIIAQLSFLTCVLVCKEVVTKVNVSRPSVRGTVRCKLFSCQLSNP